MQRVHCLWQISTDSEWQDVLGDNSKVQQKWLRRWNKVVAATHSGAGGNFPEVDFNRRRSLDMLGCRTNVAASILRAKYVCFIS